MDKTFKQEMFGLKISPSNNFDTFHDLALQFARLTYIFSMFHDYSDSLKYVASYFQTLDEGTLSIVCQRKFIGFIRKIRFFHIEMLQSVFLLAINKQVTFFISMTEIDFHH